MKNQWLLVALVAALLVVPSAAASDRLALNASRVTLAVSADGKTAVVTYRSRGALHHALVWGAVNALPPSQTVPQVRFKIDWTGGWATHRNGRWWQRLGNHCSAYDGPQLTALVAACRAPDGSYWALQSWQPKLPHRGYPPYKAGQTDWELDVSHWTTPLAELEVHADWAFNGQAHNLFGRLLYNGVPVHGFHTVKGNGSAAGPVRTQSLHQHLRLRVRPRLEARDVDRLPESDGRVLLLVLADARRVAAGATRASCRKRLEVPDRRGGPGRDAEPRRRRGRPGRVEPGGSGEGRLRTADEGAPAAALPGRQVLPDADVGRLDSV